MRACVRACVCYAHMQTHVHICMVDFKNWFSFAILPALFLGFGFGWDSAFDIFYLPLSRSETMFKRRYKVNLFFNHENGLTMRRNTLKYSLHYQVCPHRVQSVRAPLPFPTFSPDSFPDSEQE